MPGGMKVSFAVMRLIVQPIHLAVAWLTHSGANLHVCHRNESIGKFAEGRARERDLSLIDFDCVKTISTYFYQVPKL